MIDFNEVSYLANGSAKQQHVYRLLQQTRILHLLRAFDPVVIGTFPLDIQIAASDVDIACQAAHLDVFEAKLKSAFGGYSNFSVKQLSIRNENAVVATINIDGQPVEIFGQTKPTRQQMGYLHMVAEYKLLQQHGEDFKQAVISLKNQGVKTEPAFCKLLGIEGDPYMELLKFV